MVDVSLTGEKMLPLDLSKEPEQLTDIETAFLMVEFVRDHGIDCQPDHLPEIEDLRWAVAKLAIRFQVPHDTKTFRALWEALNSEKGASFVTLQSLFEPFYLEVNRKKDLEAESKSPPSDFDLF